MSAAMPDDAFAAAMAEAMERMMRDMHAFVPSGDPDQDFLAMMIPHHQGAVDMAALLLRHGHDPLVRQLAEGIVASQAIEIAAMGARLGLLEAGGGGGGFPVLTGTRGPG